MYRKEIVHAILIIQVFFLNRVVMVVRACPVLQTLLNCFIAKFPLFWSLNTISFNYEYPLFKLLGRGAFMLY